jgi:hypothetical protein
MVDTSLTLLTGRRPLPTMPHRTSRRAGASPAAFIMTET